MIPSFFIRAPISYFVGLIFPRYILVANRSFFLDPTTSNSTEEIIKLAAGRFNKKLRMWCDSAEPDRIKMWQKAGYRAKGVNKETNSVHAQIDYLKQHMIHIHPSCVNTIKEIQQWKWKKDERTNTYLEEPVPFFDDAMAMLRYSIEEERKAKPKLNRNLKGGL